MKSNFDMLQPEVQKSERNNFEMHFKELMNAGKLGGIKEEDFQQLFSGSYPHRTLNSYWNGWRERVVVIVMNDGITYRPDVERLMFEAHYKGLVKAGLLHGISDDCFIALGNGNYPHVYVHEYWIGWQARVGVEIQSGRDEIDFAVGAALDQTGQSGLGIVTMQDNAIGLAHSPKAKQNIADKLSTLTHETEAEVRAFDAAIDSAMSRTGNPVAQIIREAERGSELDQYKRRIAYLEKLVSIYGPKSLQYDIEHPNDGLNSSNPEEVLRTHRGTNAQSIASGSSIDKPEFWDLVFKFLKETPTAREARRSLIRYIHEWAAQVAFVQYPDPSRIGMTRSMVFDLIIAAAEACDDHDLPLNAADLQQIAKLFMDETQDSVANGEPE